MGKTTHNPLLTGVRGRIGDVVIKQYRSGTVITKMPNYTKRKPTERQKMHRDMFAAAVKYAKEEKYKHILKYGNARRHECPDIYYKGIQEFMRAVKQAKDPSTVYETSWKDYSIQQVTQGLIEMATTIINEKHMVKKPEVKAVSKKSETTKRVMKKKK